MLTGRSAFVRASSAETIAAILREDVPDVPAAAGVPQPLERILRRCLEKKSAERFHSAHDVGIALEALLDRSSTTSATTVAVAPGAGAQGGTGRCRHRRHRGAHHRGSGRDALVRRDAARGRRG